MSEFKKVKEQQVRKHKMRRLRWAAKNHNKLFLVHSGDLGSDFPVRVKTGVYRAETKDDHLRLHLNHDGLIIVAYHRRKKLKELEVGEEEIVVARLRGYPICKDGAYPVPDHPILRKLVPYYAGQQGALPGLAPGEVIE